MTDAAQTDPAQTGPAAMCGFHTNVPALVWVGYKLAGQGAGDRDLWCLECCLTFDLTPGSPQSFAVVPVEDAVGAPWDWPWHPLDTREELLRWLRAHGHQVPDTLPALPPPVEWVDSSPPLDIRDGL